MTRGPNIHTVAVSAIHAHHGSTVDRMEPGRREEDNESVRAKRASDSRSLKEGTMTRSESYEDTPRIQPPAK